MENEKYWYREWKHAADQSTFSVIYPQAEICWDHAASTYDMGMGNSLQRVEAVIEELKTQGYDRGRIQSVLDVGSGTGIYTLPFARMFPNVTAIDCSSQMNECLSRKSEQAGLNHISVLTADFTEHMFYDTYDLVFSSMNPGTYNPDAFEKMLSLTEKLLIYVGIIPKSVSSVEQSTLEEILFGIKLTHGGANNIKYPYELLRAKGFQPYIREVSCIWEYTIDEALAFQRKKELIEKLPCHHKNWERELKDYIQQKAVNGQITEKGDCQLGILFCDVERVDFSGCWKYDN